MKSIILFLAFIGLAGSASATPTVYRCADGTVVRAAFSSPEPAGSVRLTFARQARTVTLPRVLSADGGRYADGSVEFWIKGNAARTDARRRPDRMQDANAIEGNASNFSLGTSNS